MHDQIECKNPLPYCRRRRKETLIKSCGRNARGLLGTALSESPYVVSYIGERI
jgi:hypothetical protein